MAKIKLAPMNALPGQGAVTIGAVTIVENATIALASLASRRGQAQQVSKAAKKLGLDLPGPGKVSASTPYSALWLGPDQWMIFAPGDVDLDIAAKLDVGFGPAASITEQTGGWVCLDVTGPDLPALFERLCAIDTAAMKPGQGTRTVIEHLGCYVLCVQTGQFRVLGPRSSAQSLHHALATAAAAIA